MIIAVVANQCGDCPVYEFANVDGGMIRVAFALNVVPEQYQTMELDGKTYTMLGKVPESDVGGGG